MTTEVGVRFRSFPNRGRFESNASLDSWATPERMGRTTTNCALQRWRAPGNDRSRTGGERVSVMNAAVMSGDRRTTMDDRAPSPCKPRGQSRAFHQ